MDRYPEHRFVASQAQQFKWLEQDYPQLFKKVKAKVVDGQFLPIGGMWVESDQLLPSGESLARQFLYGQRYFKSRFGQYCRVFWLPDSFGYNSAAPQIARLAGLDYFFTQKWVRSDVASLSDFWTDACTCQAELVAVQRLPAYDVPLAGPGPDSDCRPHVPAKHRASGAFPGT